MLCDANTARGLACGQTAFQGGSIGLGIFRRFLASFTLGEVLLLAVSLAFLAYLQVAARAVAPQPDRGLTPKTDTAPRPPDSRPPSASGVFTPTVYPASTSVSGPETPLTPAQRKSFEQDFRQGGYFGAFAVSGNGAWGWTVRHADAEAAAQAALAECVHHGRDCRVIATLAPEGGGWCQTCPACRSNRPGCWRRPRPQQWRRPRCWPWRPATGVGANCAICRFFLVSRWICRRDAPGRQGRAAKPG